MKIVNDNELIHIDSSLDVIEHYGKKGMKWGVRNAISRNLNANYRREKRALKKERRRKNSKVISSSRKGLLKDKDFRRALITTAVGAGAFAAGKKHNSDLVALGGLGAAASGAVGAYSKLVDHQVESLIKQSSNDASYRKKMKALKQKYNR